MPSPCETTPNKADREEVNKNMKMVCPHCATKLEADDDISGQVVQCPSCQKDFQVNPETIVQDPVVAQDSDASPNHRGKNWFANPVVSFLMGVAVSLLFSRLMLPSGGREMYRFKYPANVEVLDAGGNVKGTMSIPVGTVFSCVRNDSSVTHNARLKPSGISCVEFKNTRPRDGAVFEAKIKLSTYYNGAMQDRQGDYWSIGISIIGEKDVLDGYVYKDSKIGKEIFEATRSGAVVKCLVLVKSLNDSILPGLVRIEDFCMLND